MNKKLLTLIVPVIIVLMGISIPVKAALGELPAYFSGTVLQGTAPAPVGTTIEARGTGVSTGPQYSNPITITQQGQYRDLLVQGDIADSTLITFYVNGVQANETWYFVQGDIAQLNLTTSQSAATPPPSSGAGGGGGGGASATLSLTGLQSNVPFSVNSYGQVQNDVILTNAGYNFNLKISKLTQIMVGSQPASSITAIAVDVTSLPPVSGKVIAMAFDFGPNGTTFSPAAALTMNYNPATLPAGVNQNSLTIAYWDIAANSWVNLGGTVDTVAHTITVSVAHFTTYAITGDVPAPAAVAPPAPATPSQPAQPVTAQPIQPVVETPAVTSLAQTPAPASTPAPESAAIPVPTSPPVPPPASQSQAGIIWIWYAAAGFVLGIIATIIIMRRRVSY